LAARSFSGSGLPNLEFFQFSILNFQFSVFNAVPPFFHHLDLLEGHD
jgi:hypothetical protein